MTYLSVSKIAKKWNVSVRSVRNYCADGRIPGAFITGKTWNIPENADQPERKNKKSKKLLRKTKQQPAQVKQEREILQTFLQKQAQIL